MKLTKHIKMHGDNTISIFCVDNKNRLQGFSEAYDEKIKSFGKPELITRAVCYKNNLFNGLSIHSWNEKLEVLFYKNDSLFGQHKKGIPLSDFNNFYPTTNNV
jgi:hypothetical protein